MHGDLSEEPLQHQDFGAEKKGLNILDLHRKLKPKQLKPKQLRPPSDSGGVSQPFIKPVQEPA